MSIITGYEGIKCGLGAVYTVLAALPDEVYGKTVLPIFPKEQALRTTQTFPFKITDNTFVMCFTCLEEKVYMHNFVSAKAP